MKHTRTAAIAASMVGLITTAGLAEVTLYEVVDLGQPDPHDCSCNARAINIAGAVAGFFFGTDGDYNGFVATGGAMIDFSPPGENRTQGLGINDAGLVVGWTNHIPSQAAILYDGQNVIDLGTLGGRYGTAYDINNVNQIVGMATTALPVENQRPAIWQDGGVTDLGTLGGEFGKAFAINDLGLIVGWAWNDARDRRAVSWTADLAGPFELPSFSPPDLSAMALAVNNVGQIVGEVQMVSPTPVFHAALWDNGAVIDLGVLPEAGQGTSPFGGPPMITTSATGINDAGVIIGNSIPPAEIPDVRHGPFVHRDGVMTNLNDLLHESSAGWVIRGVQAINNDGVIAGDGEFAGGVRHAVLLVPVETGITGDLDGDGDVDITDFLQLLGNWGPCTVCTADLDGDNAVGITDLLILLGAWTTP